MYLRNPANKQKGIGLPATVFLITIVAIIVLAMGELNESSVLGFGQDFNSQRAFYAAESGAQIALNRVFMGDEACNASLATINFGSTNGLNNCTAELTCSSITVDSVNYLTFDSTGTCGSGFEQSTRTIQVRAHTP